MADVPQIVRERLRTQAVVGEHPDANLLPAFAERALTEQERAQVLDHLSRCAECRQVVALSALPQVEEERRVAAAVASRSWWRSPVVHWGALTAAALVVLIAVGTRMRLREGHSASAPAVALSSNQAAQTPTMQAPAVSQSPPEQKESRKLVQTGGTVGRAETFNGRRPMGAVSGGKVASRDTVATGGSAPSPVATSNAAAAPAPPPAALKKVAPPAGADAIQGPPLEKQRKIDQAQVQAVPVPSTTPKQAVEAAGSAGVTASAAPAPKSEAAALSQRSGAGFARRAPLSPRWSVSDSGALQRSFDGGRRWKEVAVAEGVTFRAVAVVVNDVWAGGSGGALFHSADGGEHWARVRIQANGRTPSGDIVRIEFTDARDGVVATSTGETWTTSDAGATWRSQ